MNTSTHTTLKNRFRRRLEEEAAAMEAFCNTKGPERHDHLRRSKRLRSRVFRMNALLWGVDMPARLIGLKVIAL
jgi:hypothetical protein